MKRYIVLLAIVLLFSGVVFADQYTTASVVAVQEHQYDLEQLVNSIQSGVQDRVYDNEVVASSSVSGSQDTVYENEQVVGVTQVDLNYASIPEIKYKAVYDETNDVTDVTVEIISTDPVSTYNVFVFDPNMNEIYSYSTTSKTSTFRLNGRHEVLFIIVLTNNIGYAGILDLGSYPAFVYGSNIIPVSVDANNTYYMYVYGGYALSPIGSYNTLYVIAKVHVVDIYTSTVEKR